MFAHYKKFMFEKNHIFLSPKERTVLRIGTYYRSCRVVLQTNRTEERRKVINIDFHEITVLNVSQVTRCVRCRKRGAGATLGQNVFNLLTYLRAD